MKQRPALCRRAAFLIPCNMRCILMTLTASLLALLATAGFVPAYAQELPGPVKVDVDTNEDRDAKRLAEKKYVKRQPVETLDVDLYGSLRLHAINAYDVTTGSSDLKLADGASQAGATGNWRFKQNWNVFGRLEYGFNLIDTVTAKAQTDSGGNLTPRLHNLGLESEALFVKFGKSWSTYYQVAGAADRFSIFGGDAAGIYNAGTDGGATGTGRADSAFQTHLFLDFGRWTHIKPIKLNAQYQHGEPIPHADGFKYGSAYSLSAWFETERNIGVGLAWHNASIDSSDRNLLAPLGIDGDAQA